MRTHWMDREIQALDKMQAPLARTRLHACVFLIIRRRFISKTVILRSGKECRPGSLMRLSIMRWYIKKTKEVVYQKNKIRLRWLVDAPIKKTKHA